MTVFVTALLRINKKEPTPFRKKENGSDTVWNCAGEKDQIESAARWFATR